MQMSHFIDGKSVGLSASLIRTVRLGFGIKQSDGWTMSLTEFMCEHLILLFRNTYSRDLV